MDWEMLQVENNRITYLWIRFETSQKAFEGRVPGVCASHCEEKSETKYLGNL